MLAPIFYSVERMTKPEQGSKHRFLKAKNSVFLSYPYREDLRSRFIITQFGEVVPAECEFCYECFILCVLKGSLLVKEADETLFLENDIRGTYSVRMKINLKYCSSGSFPSAFRAAIHCSSRSTDPL